MKSSTNFIQGDIVYVNLNPTAGHEQGNLRPVIILNRKDIPLPGDLYIVAPITSHKKSYPLELELPANLKTHGVALIFQLRTLDLNARNAKFVENAGETFTFQCCSLASQLISVSE